MKFNEKEVGGLIQRASELHESSLADEEHNLTLSETEAIAKELGIPSRFLIEAALEHRSGHGDSSFSIWGAPFRVNHHSIFEGHFTDEQWEEALSEFQEFSGKSGSTETLGTTRRWSHVVGEGDSGFNFEELSVSVRPMGERTSIRLKKEYKGAVAMYFMAFAVTSFMTLIIAHSLPGITKISELVYAGLGGLLSLGGVRAMISASAKRYKEDLNNLASRIGGVVEKPAKETMKETLESELELLRMESSEESKQESILDETGIDEEVGEVAAETQAAKKAVR